MALTCAGLALPLVADITFPTSALNAFSLPALYSAMIAAFAESTSLTIFSIVAASETCLNPKLWMISVTDADPVLGTPGRVGVSVGVACPGGNVALVQSSGRTLSLASP